MAASKWHRCICPDRRRHQIIRRRGRVERFPPRSCILRQWAIIGLFKPPHNSSLDDLQIGQRLRESGQFSDCVIVYLNTNTRVIDYCVGTEPEENEITDASALPGIQNPLLVDPKSEEVKYFTQLKIP